MAKTKEEIENRIDQLDAYIRNGERTLKYTKDENNRKFIERNLVADKQTIKKLLAQLQN
jgi:hypothetical protein